MLSALWINGSKVCKRTWSVSVCGNGLFPFACNLAVACLFVHAHSGYAADHCRPRARGMPHWRTAGCRRVRRRRPSSLCSHTTGKGTSSLPPCCVWELHRLHLHQVSDQHDQ